MLYAAILPGDHGCGIVGDLSINRLVLGAYCPLESLFHGALP